jgi:hypothetical protein
MDCGKTEPVLRKSANAGELFNPPPTVSTACKSSISTLIPRAVELPRRDSPKGDSLLASIHYCAHTTGILGAVGGERAMRGDGSALGRRAAFCKEIEKDPEVCPKSGDGKHVWEQDYEIVEDRPEDFSVKYHQCCIRCSAMRPLTLLCWRAQAMRGVPFRHRIKNARA